MLTIASPGQVNRQVLEDVFGESLTLRLHAHKTLSAEKSRRNRRGARATEQTHGEKVEDDVDDSDDGGLRELAGSDTIAGELQVNIESGVHAVIQSPQGVCSVVLARQLYRHVYFPVAVRVSMD